MKLQTYKSVSMILALTFTYSTVTIAGNDVPVKIGGEADYDACSSIGVVNGLDPNGSGFLPVRTAPSEDAKEIDRIPNGKVVTFCDETKKWTGIVYSKKDGVDCQVNSPVAKRRPYTGPCTAGWVKTQFLKLTAG